MTAGSKADADWIPPASACPGAIHDCGKVDPGLVTRTRVEPTVDAPDDQLELVVTDPVHEDHSCVRAVRCCPLSQDAREVADVVGDEDTLLSGREREHVVIVESLEARLLVEGAHIVPCGLELPAHAWPGDVCVEEEAHRRRLVAGREERIEGKQLIKRAMALLEEWFDLLREAFSVRPCEPEVAVADEWMALVELRTIASVGTEQLDDLPDIESAPDRPGPARCAAEGDAGKET
jgi:hypothetical protein